MADRYVNPAAGGANTGGNWTDAYLTLKQATDAAAAGEKIYFANGTADVITVNTTYTLAAGVQIISTSDTTNNPPTTFATGASVTSVTSGVDIAFAGQGAIFGVKFAPATAGASTLSLCTTDEDILYCEDCIFEAPSTTASSIILGSNVGTRINAELKTKRCTWLFGATGSYIYVGALWSSINDIFCSSGTVPTTLIGAINTNNAETIIHSADLSAVNTTLVVGQSNSPAVVKISSSALHSSVTPLGTTISGAGTTITLFDCSYDNAGTRTGTLFYHENHLGSTSVSLAIYANDGLLFDGTNRCSWVVDGKAAATFDQPYESPWIDYYNSDISTSVTPYLECVRDGSATAYTNELVWPEFSYRDTANSPLMAFATGRRGPLATAANLTSSSLTGSDWTGENATAWFGKLDAPAAFTADEVGYMRARICVAGNNTVYVDPQIRF